MKKSVAISIGDLNGIGIQLALENHNAVAERVKPLYCIDTTMLQQVAQKLHLPIPKSFDVIENIAPHFEIRPKHIDAHSGLYAYQSFLKAVELAKAQKVDAICTLPIHKKAWELAGVKYKGHTDALRDIFQQEAIMMLGCPQMYVALFTEHIPLRDVADKITVEKLTLFLVDFYRTTKPQKPIAVLGLNPHAGDDGVLGNEERIITKAITKATQILAQKYFDVTFFVPYPLVPDVAFTPKVRSHYSHFVAMYHDQGLAPLKALYFEEAINVSLNLPIVRTSVDHGTAFDIAYSGTKPNAKSYLNAIAYIKGDV